MTGPRPRIRYHLEIAAPHTHLVEVTVEVTGASRWVDLAMPAWTPGSYLIRAFARNVQDFRAEAPGGGPLEWQKQDASTWRIIAPAGGGAVRARYRVYANELSVRTSHVDDTHAFVAGAGIFMRVAGLEAEAISLEICAPDGWETVTPLPRAPDGSFRAREYEELVDAPLEIGTSRVVGFEAEDVPHRYAFWGEGNWREGELVEDTRRIVRASRELFGSLPYDAFTIIVHLVPGGRGGLEHRTSTVLQAEPGAFRGRPYERFLALVAHELFHVWNGKRIRPTPLGPFDYDREVHTRNLWVMEGLTTYYTDRILLRAGLVTPRRYLERLAESIDRYLLLPGRLHQTLAEASFDAWIKLYRPDASSPNSQISYYHKGALVGLLLDLEIRERTAGERSLDDVMRLLWSRYGEPDVGFPEESRDGFEAVVSEATGLALGERFDRWLRTTAELELDEGLARVGLGLARHPLPPAAPEGEREALDLVLRGAGARLRTRGGGDDLQVVHVLADTPAERGGLNAGDRILAADGLPPTPGALAQRILDADGGPLCLTLLRRGRERRVSLDLLAHPPPGRIRIARRDDAPATAESRRTEWLGAGPD